MQRIRNRKIVQDAELYRSMGSSVQVSRSTKVGAAFDPAPTMRMVMDLFTTQQLSYDEIPQEERDRIEQETMPFTQRQKEIDDFIISQGRRGFQMPEDQASRLREERLQLTTQIQQVYQASIDQQISIGTLRTPEELNIEYADRGYNFTAPMGQAQVDFIINRQIERQTQEALLQSGPTDLLTTGLTFGATLASYALDPIELSSAFIPVVGQAKYANWIRKLGKYGGRGAKGLVEGTAGAIMTEPLYLALGKQAQMDISMTDSLMNVGIGAILGSGIGVTIGKFSRGTAGQQAARIEQRISRPTFNKQYLSETARIALTQGVVTGKIDIMNVDARGLIPTNDFKGVKYQSHTFLPDKLKEDLQPVVIRTDAKGNIKVYNKKGNAERLLSENEEVIPYQSQSLVTPGEVVEGVRPTSGYIIVKKIPGEIVKTENGKVLTFETKEEALALIKADPLFYDLVLKKPLANLIEIPTARGKEYGIAINMAKENIEIINRQVRADSVIIKNGVDATKTSVLKELDGGMDSLVYGKQADKIILDRVMQKGAEDLGIDDITARLEEEYSAEDLDESIGELEKRIDLEIKNVSNTSDPILKLKQELDALRVKSEAFINNIDEVLEEGVFWLSGDTASKAQALDKMNSTYRKLTGSDNDLIKQTYDELNKIITRRLSRDADLDAPLSLELTNELREEAIALANNLKESFKQEKRQHLLSALAFQTGWNRAIKAYELTGDASIGIQDLIVESERFYEGAGVSSYQVGVGERNIFKTKLVLRLQKDELMGLFKYMTPDDEKAVADVVQKINRIVPIKKEDLYEIVDGKQVPIRDDIYNYAKLMADFSNDFRLSLNNAGANIKFLNGYITGQKHNKTLIANAKDAWVISLKEKLDFKKMSVAKVDEDEFLDTIYNNITNPINPIKLNASDQLSEIRILPRNLANRLQQERVLVFKSGADWYNYNKEFGKVTSLRESLLLDIEATSRQLGLLKTFGPNPGYVLEKLKREILVKYPDQKTNVNRTGVRPKLETYLDYVSGYTNIAEHETAAKVGQFLRLIQTMSKLGAAIFPSISDIFTMTGQQRSLGNGLGKSLKNSFEALYLGRVAKKNMKEYSEFLSIGAESLLGDFVSRLDATDVFNGSMAKNAQLFFKLNLLLPWTESARTGIAMIIARDIAKQSTKNWNSVPIDLRGVLERYNITKSNWDIVKKAVKTFPDGKKYISPTMFDELNIDKKTADELRLNLSMLLDSESGIAVPIPGARTQTIVTGGYRPGTVSGEAVRSIMQFKSFAITAQSKVFGRQRYAYGQSQKGGANYFKEMSGRGLLGITEVMASMTVAGAIATQASQLASGKTAREYNGEFVYDSFLRGGAGLLYADVLFSRAAGYGQDPLIGLLGPNASVATNILGIASGFQPYATEGNTTSQVMSLVKSNTPYANLFYTKEVVNYLFWYQLQESLNPGYLRRIEERVELEGQEYLFKPSRHVIYNDGKIISNID